MRITSSLRFLYIFGGSGLLCGAARRQILWKLSWSKLKFLTWLLFKQSFTRHVIQSMSAEERRRAAAGRSEARRGKVGSVARHTGTFDENSFHSTIHSAPKEGRGVKRSKNGWENLNLCNWWFTDIQPYLYKIEITTMRNSIVFGRFKHFFFSTLFKWISVHQQCRFSFPMQLCFF